MDDDDSHDQCKNLWWGKFKPSSTENTRDGICKIRHVSFKHSERDPFIVFTNIAFAISMTFLFSVVFVGFVDMIINDINSCLKTMDGSFDTQSGCSAGIETLGKFVGNITVQKNISISNNNMLLHFYDVDYMFTYGSENQYGPVSCFNLSLPTQIYDKLYDTDKYYTIYVMKTIKNTICTVNKTKKFYDSFTTSIFVLVLGFFTLILFTIVIIRDIKNYIEIDKDHECCIRRRGYSGLPMIV